MKINFDIVVKYGAAESLRLATTKIRLTDIKERTFSVICIQID